MTHLFGKSKSVQELDIDKLNREIAHRMAEEIETKFRGWIRLSDDKKLKALLDTIEVKEMMTMKLKQDATKVINSLKKGDCWCDAGPGSDCQCFAIYDFLTKIETDQSKKEIADKIV